MKKILLLAVGAAIGAVATVATAMYSQIREHDPKRPHE